MADKMWFGNARGHMQFVPCPLIDSSVARNRYVETIRFENGGGDGRRSPQYQMQYDLVFNGLAHELDGIDAFNKYAQGFYGNDLIYLAHPATFETNMFPAGWATPSLAEQGWGKISSDAVSYADADGPSVTNLVTNPSMEGVASGTDSTKRVNLVTNPSFESNTTGWYFNSSGILSRTTAEKYIGTASLSFYSDANDRGPRTNITVTNANAVHTFSAWVKAPAGTLLAAIMHNNVTGGQTTNFVGTGDWQRVSASYAASGTTNMFAYIQSRQATAVTFYVDAVMVEAAPDMRPYFDGNYSEDPTYIPEWNGTVNNSTSDALVRGVSNRENLVTNPSFEVDLTGWTNFGPQTSTRIITDSYSGTSSLQCPATVANAGVIFNLYSIEVNKTYTYSTYVKGEIGKTLYVEILEKDLAGVEIGRNTSAYFAMTGSWQRINISRNFGGSGVRAELRVRTGNNSPIHTFLVDAVMLEQSTTVNPYFDGSYTDMPGWATSWAGTANASRSVATAAPVTVRTNLVTNPSMESVTSGTVVMRRNLIPNPNFETNTTDWVAGSSTISRDTATYYSGSASLKVVTPGSVSGEGTYKTNTGVAGLVAGSKFSGSAWVKGVAGTALQVTLASQGTGAIDPSTNFTATGDWQYVKVENATLGTSINPYIVIRTQGILATTFYVDNVIVEMGSTVGDYFDGSTTDALGWDYAWSGTANASISTAACAATTVRTNLVTNPSFEVDTTGWTALLGAVVSRDTVEKYVGSASMKVVTNGSAVYQAARFTTTGTNGATYTASAWVKFAAGVNFYILISDTSNVTIQTYVGTGSWQRVSVTRTVATTQVLPEIGVNPATSTTFYVDAVQLEVGSTASDFFDGSFQPAGDFSYAWTGTANASTSIQRGATVTGWTGGSAIPVQARGEKYVGNSSLAVYAQTGDQYGGAPSFTVTPSTTYTASAWVKGTVGKNVYIGLVDNNSGGQTYGTPVTMTGTWQRISVTRAVSAAATGVYVFIRNGSFSGVHTFYVDAVMLEASPIVQDYFDGSVVSADADLTNSWSGTAHASTSLMRGVGVATVSYFNGVAIQSSGWASTGTKSIRVIPTISDTSSAGFFAVTTTVGQTYTAKAKVRLASIQTGTLNPNARKIVAYNSTITTFLGASNQAPNTVGVSEVSMTFVATTTTSNIIFYSGASAGNGDVWLDDFIVVAGTYTGDYFDGNSTDSGNTTYAWTGTANASTSTMLSEMVLYGNPRRAATYTVTNINVPPTKVCTLVIPPTHTLYLGASGTSTGSAGVFIRPIQASDSLYYGPLEELTLLDPNGSVRMNKTLNGATYQAVEIFLMKTDTNPGTVTLNSLMAQLYKTGSIPALPSNHYQGEGSTGLMFADDAIVETYSYMHPPRKGISTTLIEVEAWR